ncbi:hypothetical protein MBORA_16080 [Methanobrevibacter oralis]|uniref:Uncharacterized protein n=2 Tax=Methanobrevibacter oralis TaxID=66851 RepID=A0A165ZZ91_METOA|nr:hypothetical protein [Methanobrevibacter oralis]KZX11363.1 hypothetical protein MBORA_16080 [Methanobrevibacter oralis]
MPSINNLKSEINEELARDKIILEHIQHRYEEEERRFQTVDGKINSMIAVLAGIFTLQASLFTIILSSFSKVEYCLIFLFVFSLILYLISIYYFIKAYTFKKVSATPKPSFLMELGANDESEHEIVKNMIGLYGSCVEDNEKSTENKTEIAKKGFSFLRYGGWVTFIFFVFLVCTL